MSRRKAACNCSFPFWLSAKRDCREGRFIQVGNSLLLSPAFQELSTGARCLYLCCTLEAGGRKNFIFPQAAAKKYGFAPRSMRRHMAELLSSGFIELESSGRITRQENLYCFSTQWRNKLANNN